MFKLKTVLLSLLTFTPLVNATVYFPTGVTAETVKTANVQIAWDIHDVLAIEDGKAKIGAVARDIFPIIWSKITPNAAWKEIEEIKKTNDISGEGYMYVFLKHGEKKLARMAESAANAYKPRPGMEQLVLDINYAGITQRLASNIGQDFVGNLDTKFKTKHACNLFNFIQPGKVVDYSIYGPEHLKKKSFNPQVSPFGKPNIEFFYDFNKTYNPNNESIIIFIDNKIGNVQAAVNAGWIGIHLDVKQKNPTATVRSELASLGIFDKKAFTNPLNNGIHYV